MSENSFKSIINGTIASIIAGIVLLAIPSIRGYVVSCFVWLCACIVWCWNALLLSYSLPIPGWAWLSIFAFAGIGLVNTYIALRGEKKPEFLSYTEDYIYGARWRWSWRENRISNLWCYCLTCDATLVYDDSSCIRSLIHYAEVKQTDFICENCGHRVVATITGGNKIYAIGAVEREIERRVRTDEYKRLQTGLVALAL